MAHEMTATDVLLTTGGVAAWHGLGLTIPDTCGAVEGMERIGMGWSVEQEEMVTASGLVIPDDVANIRSDTREVLGVVGKGYVPLQNREVAEFADSLGNGTGVKVETIGSVFGGRRTYFLLRGDSIYAGKDKSDEVKTYILLANGHDGTLSVVARNTSVRVVCNNTLGMALRGKAQLDLKFKHEGAMVDKIKAAKTTIEAFCQQRKEFAAVVETLNNRSLNTQQIQSLFCDIYTKFFDSIPDAAATEKSDIRKRKTAIKTIGMWSDNFDKDRQQVSNDATAWVALNAVTEYLDHQQNLRGGTPEEQRDRRVNNNLMGMDATLKTNILNEVLQLT